MSKPDFFQIAEDHASLLVLVRPIGTNIKPKTFNKLFERISQINYFNVPKPHRNVRFKYKRSYTKDESSWGTFQAHRKVVGLITIGKCNETQTNEDNVDNNNDGCSPVKSQSLETKSDLVMLHQQTAELFEDTLLDSILIILDSTYVNDRESTPDTPDNDSKNMVNGDTNIRLGPDGSCYFGDVFRNEQRSNKTSNGEMSASHLWLFKGVMDCDELELKMQDFFNSLFWVLESKRMDRSQERNDSIALLMAPPEKETNLPMDVESSTSVDKKSEDLNIFQKRSHKRKCLGHYKKHLGDLSLLAGIPGEASLHYQTCLDTLKTTNDWLWIAGAQEGLAVASYLILKPKSTRPSTLNFNRNVSFSSNKKLSNRNRDSSMAATLQAAAASTLQSGLDLANNRVTTSVTTEILHEDILTNYKEAIVNYSKVKESSIIEMEASLKACRILTMYRRVIDAADFLQNVVKINPQLTDDEKIEQFTTLANLYSELGLTRKSAFYNRVAAMVCVAPTNRKESWSQCCSLLLQSLSGFKLSLDYRDMIGSSRIPIGWPSVKLRVMHELIYSRRRLGDVAAAIRHICLLLHSMHDHLSPSERVELCSVLQSYSSKCHSTPNSMALEDGTILPPVPLTKIPEFRSLHVSELPVSQLCKFQKNEQSDHQSTEAGTNNNPFIYSPFMNSQLEATARSANKNKKVTWIEGTKAHITLTFRNTLPIVLQVTDLDLIIEGSMVEVQPIGFTMAASIDEFKVVMSVTPCSNEDFKVTGYTWEVFGVKNNVRFSDLRGALKKQNCSLSSQIDDLEEKYDIEVKPRLPLLQTVLSSSLMTAEISEDRSSGSQSPASSGSMVIYAGQRHVFKIALLNTGTMPIDRIDLHRSSKHLDEEVMTSMIRCLSEGLLMDRLPLQQGDDLELEFEVEGLMDFISMETTVAGGRIEACSHLQRRENLLRGLQRLISPGGTLRADLALHFQYSGGKASDSCRQSTINIPLFILPSISILQWKVMPGRSSASIDLCLEVKNSTELMVEVSVGGQSSKVICVEPFQAVWLNCAMEKMTNSIAETNTDPSLDDFDLLSVKCEGYRDRLVNHVGNNVDLRWKMPVVNVEGNVSLDDIPYTREDCVNLQKPLLFPAITVDNKLLLESTIEISVLDRVEVNLILKNDSDFDFHKVNMSLSLDDEEQDAIVLIGALRTNQILMKPGELVSSHFSMLSTRCSTNRIAISCSASSHPDLLLHPSICSSTFLSTPLTVSMPSSSSTMLTISGSIELVADDRPHPKLTTMTDISEVETPASSKVQTSASTIEDAAYPASDARNKGGVVNNSSGVVKSATADGKIHLINDRSDLTLNNIPRTVHKWLFILDVHSKFSEYYNIETDGYDDDAHISDNRADDNPMDDFVRL